MPNTEKRLNLVYFFFEDDFFRWPMRNKLESFVNTNKGSVIIGVTFPVSLLTLLSNPRRFFKLLWYPKKKWHESIYSFTPFSILPVDFLNRDNFLLRFHKEIFKKQIDRFLNKINAKENRITWFYGPWAFPIFCEVVRDNKLLVYDCEDEYTMKEDAIIEPLRKMEDRLLAEADVVFATSKNLYETRKVKNQSCCYVPNGVDFSFFSKAADPGTLIDPQLKDMPKPIIGYLGNTRSWLDFELLAYLIDYLPAASFVFVGPVEQAVKSDVAALKRRPNVHFLDCSERKLLPSVLKAFDACLIPFKLNQFNLATNPFKFWEYLATGKPIVSLRLPDLEPYEDVLSLYTTKEEALEKLKSALLESDPWLRGRRMEIARDNDLSSRSRRYYEVLIKYLNEQEYVVDK